MHVTERPVASQSSGYLQPIVPAGSGIDLSWYLQTIWRSRLVIAGVAVASAVVGLTLAWFATPAYRATATLTVTQSKVGEVAANGVLTGASFLPLLTNHKSALATIHKHGLDKPPYNFTSFRFLERAVTVSDVRNTNLLTASVVLPDAQLAADVVNDLADSGVELSHRLSQDEAVRARDIIGAHLRELTTRLQAAETQLLTFQREGQIDLLKGEVDALLEQRRDLPELLVRIASERARLARAEQELAARSPTTTVQKTIDSDPAMMEAAQRKGDSSVLGLQLRSQSPNPTFEVLDQEVAASRAELAALEKKRSQLIEVNHLGAPQLERLSTLYQKESALARLKLDHQLAQQAYSEAAARYENAMLQVASRSAELQVIDPAVPPDRPVSPRPLRDTFVWFAAGLLGASLVTLIAGAAAPGRD